MLAADAANDPDDRAAIVAAVSAGYAVSIASLVSAWLGGRRAPWQLAGRDVLTSYKIRSALWNRVLSDVMLILTIVAGIAGLAIGATYHSWWLGAAVGGVVAPAYTAHRRLEKASERSEKSADLADQQELDMALRRVELEQRRQELDIRQREFELEMEQKWRELIQRGGVDDGEAQPDF